MNTPGLSGVTWLTAPEMEAAYLCSLGFAGAATVAPSTLMVIAALLRSAVWALTGGGSEPVYVTRVLNAARRLALPALVDSARASSGDATVGSSTAATDSPEHTQFRAALDELESLGDLAALPQGRWLPGPLRVVALPATGRWILVGGLPSHYLPASLHPAMEYNGAARLLTALPNGTTFPQQTLTDWCAAPTVPLPEWTHEIMACTELLPFEDTTVQFEFYTPPATMSKSRVPPLQYYRWTAEIKSLASGRYLARRISRLGPIHYSITEVLQSRVVKTHPIDSGSLDVRRLLYGLDARADASVRVAIEQRTPDVTEFILRNELPIPEQRLMTALGELRLPTDGHYYPRRWVIPNQYTAEVLNALERLCIQIDRIDR